MTPKVIATAVDRYTPFTPAELKALKAAGVDAIVAYIGRHTRGLMNGITPQNLKDYTDAGMKVIFNFEGGSNHRSYFNVAEGKRDGSDVVKEMAWLGITSDHGIVIYNSVDYDAYTQADFDAVDAYEAAFQGALKGAFSEGEYGGITVLKHSDGTKHAPSGDWQTVAWSDGRQLATAKLYQAKVNVWIAHLQVDLDEVYADPGWYPRPFVQANPSQGGTSTMQTGKAKLNGKEYPSAVVNGDTMIDWSALASLPGFSKRKAANGEWEFTVATQTPAPATPSRDTIPTVSSGGFTYPLFIVPSTKDLSTAGTEVTDEKLGIRVLQAMGKSQAQIEHYLVNWYGYSADIAHTEAVQNYPVMQQTADEYKAIDHVLVAHADSTQPNGIKTETITDAVNVALYFKDGTSTAFVN